MSRLARREPLIDAVGGRSLYPLFVLTALNAVDEFAKSVVAVFAPNIRETFHISNTKLGLLVGLSVVFLVITAIPLGYIATRVNRVRLLRWSAGAWSVCSVANAFTRSPVQFGLAQLGSGISEATVEPIGKSLLADLYPPETWNRVFAFHTAANPAGSIIGPLLCGLVAVIAGGNESWRWAFPIVILPTLVAMVFLGRVEEPAVSTSALLTPDAGIGRGMAFKPAVQRLLRIPTFQRMMVAMGALGFATIGFLPFLSLYLDKDLHVGEGGRGIVIAILSTAALIGTLAGGRLGERAFAESPARAMRLVGVALVLFGIITAVGLLMPTVAGFVAALWLASVCVSLASAPLGAVLTSVSPPGLRPLMFALIGLCFALFGGLFAAVLVGWIVDQAGLRVGLLTMMPVYGLGGLLMFRASVTVDADIEALSADAEMVHEVDRRRSGGESQLALSTRRLDVWYGTVQILFSVDIDVADGEVVALLGTNGAGKSTLLRALSGLEPPGRGTVRFFGEDVTSWPAEARVAHGLAMVYGGKATFPSLTVRESLRAGAYPFHRNRARTETAIGNALVRFPALAARLDQRAGTLSGGEQQQLALARALVSEPRVLLVDELSLGLAPLIVDELFEALRALAADGVTIVLVEQSADRAATLADRAYFLERGAVAFEGSPHDLLRRHDLIRPVLLATTEG